MEVKEAYMPVMDLLKAIDGVVQVDSQTGVPQTIYVVEECSELTKALMKEERGKGDREAIIEESIDVLTTVMILLRGMGVSPDEVKNKIIFKCNRAINRWLDDGEA